MRWSKGISTRATIGTFMARPTSFRGRGEETRLHLKGVQLVVTWLVLASPCGATKHNPLLPWPQQIHYGDGRFLVRNTSIRLAFVPTAEDRFAADSLAACLSDLAVAPILVSESRSSNRLITFRRTGGDDPLPVPGERPGPDSRESYSIKITSHGGELQAKSSAGLYYGAQTLCQLVEGWAAEAVLPEVEMHDWPSLAYRGTMVDMSHGPLPTEEEVERQIDSLARWKANQYYFYNEASIELDGFRLVNPGARFTKDQIRRIVAYARERHIDVVPCLELYGHLHDLFRLERYSDLAAVPHGSEFNPNKPEVIRLLTNWVDQLADLFPSLFFHVGMDETWELEKFAKSEAEGITPAKLYLKHFGKVAELVNKHGKHIMMWGDILLKYPEIIPQLPPETILVPWNYGPENDFKHFLAPFASSRLPQFVATGVTMWNEIAPDFDLSFDNIDSFLAAGKQFGILGHINTIWMDSAQVFLRPALSGIAYGAAAAWQSTPIDRSQFFSVYSSLMYPRLVAEEVAPALRNLNDAERHLQTAIGQETMLRFWSKPLDPTNLQRSREHQDDLRQARLLAEEAQDHVDRAMNLARDNSTLTCLFLLARMIDYAAMRNLYAVEMADFWAQLGPHPKKEDVSFLLFAEINYHDHGRTADLMDTITELREAYRNEWLAEYNTYRLGAALAKWDSEFDYWWNFKRRLDSFANHFQDGQALPSLESFGSEE